MFYQVIKDGQILGTRTSDRTYTHAIVTWADTRFDASAWRAASKENPKAEPRDFYVKSERCVQNISYAGSLALAQKQAGRPNLEVIPLTILEKKPRKGGQQ